VSAEELNQLAERGIPAYDMLQRKLGLTRDQMQNIGNAGIDGKVAVDALIQSMEEWAKGMMDAQSKTAGGLWSNLVDSAKQYLLIIMGINKQGDITKGSAFDLAKRKMDSLLKTLDKMEKDGTLQEWATKVQKAISSAFKKASELFDYIIKNWPQIKAAIEGFIGLWASVKLVNALASTITALQTIYSLITSIGAIAAAPIVITVALAGLWMEADKLSKDGTAQKWGRQLGTKYSKYGPDLERPEGSHYTNSGHLPSKADRENLAQFEAASDAAEKSTKAIQAAFERLNVALKKKIVPPPPTVFPKITDNKTTVADVMNDMEAQLSSTRGMAKLARKYGNPYDESGEKQGVMESAIQSLLEIAYDKTRTPAQRDAAQTMIADVYGRLNKYILQPQKNAAPDAPGNVADVLAQGMAKSIEESNKARINAAKGQAYAKDATLMQARAELPGGTAYESSKRFAKRLAEAQGQEWDSDKYDLENLPKAIEQSMQYPELRGKTEEYIARLKELTSKTDAQTKAAEKWTKQQEALKDVKSNAQSIALSSMPVASNAVNVGESTAKALAGAGIDPMISAAVTFGMVLLSIIADSKTFQTLMASINPIIQAAADALGMLLQPLLPIASMLGSILIPILTAFGTVIGNALMPAMQLLFPVIKWLGVGVMYVVKGLMWGYNAIVKGINWALGWLGVHLNEVDLDGYQDAINSLTALTWDQAMATAKAADAANDAAEALKNVPQVFKAALVRGQVALPAYAEGGIVKATPGGRAIIAGDGGEDEYIVPRSKMGGSGLIVNVNVNAPGYDVPTIKRIAREGVFEAVDQAGMKAFGVTPAYAGGRGR
jgi:hypothetical protein